MDAKTIKVVLVGDGAVGKTSLLTRYTNGNFNPIHEPTVSENSWVDRIIDNQRFELALFDTAGQENFDKLRLLTYQDTDVFIVAFSLDSDVARNNVVNKWIPEIKAHAEGVPHVLVGTKSDLREEAGAAHFSFESGKKLALQVSSVAYHECSALSTTGCNALFELAVREALKTQNQPKECCHKSSNGKSRRKKWLKHFVCF